MNHADIPRCSCKECLAPAIWLVVGTDGKGSVELLTCEEHKSTVRQKIAAGLGPKDVLQIRFVRFAQNQG